MAKTVNLGDPLTRRVTLRLTEKQFGFLTDVSTIVGVSPSDYLRMMVNASMTATNETIEVLKSGKVGMSNENIKTDINNLV